MDDISQTKRPDDFNIPGLSGSISWGITLIVIGFVLFLHTKFNISMDWLQEWWPLGIMLIGGILVYKAIKDKPDQQAFTGSADNDRIGTAESDVSFGIIYPIDPHFHNSPIAPSDLLLQDSE